MTNEITFPDGTPFDPPKNPLKEKWDKLYPPTPMPYYSQVCDGYSCMWCGRCPSGDYWKVPEEDKDIYDKWYKEYNDYCDSHGGLLNARVMIHLLDQKFNESEN